MNRGRLILTTAVFFALLGVAAWLLMPRQEDPSMPPTFGMVVATYPGADAQTVERLVLDRLEESLADVEDIKKIQSTARAEVAIIQVELRDGTSDTDTAWDEVKAAVDRARVDMPAGLPPPTLDRKLTRTQSVVFAVTGSADHLELRDGAETLKRALLSLPQVAEVTMIADPGEQITVAYDDSAARSLGLDGERLRQTLQARNSATPGGSLAVGSRTTSIRPNSELTSVAELQASPIPVPGGGVVALGQVADVRRTVSEPATERMRHRGEPAVAVGVVPHAGINLVEFGQAVQKRVEEKRAALAPLRVDTLVFQPDRVEQRLSDLGVSLLIGIIIVAGVLIGFMGVRLGLLVSSVIPLVAAASVALFAAGGGVLHQISIAALVLALGMLVDNAIVVAEGVQRRLDEGESRLDATRNTVRELWLPLASATGTTLAAFVPMLLSEGPTAEFTRSIPVVLMLSLTVSYVFAVAVTPLLAGALLKPSPRHSEQSTFERIALKLGAIAVRRRYAVLIGAGLLVAGSAALMGQVEQQFFPSSDRNQLIVSLEHAEGTHFEETEQTALAVEQALAAHPDVVSVSGFTGRSTPKFYYNLPTRPQAPHLAQILVDTKDVRSVETVSTWVRQYVQKHHPAATVVARGLEQGPPVLAPIEIRLVGDDLAALSAAADQVAGTLRQTPGTRDVRHDAGMGVPTVRFTVDDAAATRFGLSRDDVARSLLGQTRGLTVGQMRQGTEPIPIVVRSAQGEFSPASHLASTDIGGGAQRIPLAQLGETEVEWQPASIRHYQRDRAVSVLAELDPNVPFSRVLRELTPKLDAMELPDGVEWQLGGAQEGAGRANSALVGALPIGIFLLLFILLAQFNSFRRLILILVTVPLAAIGVIPGLLISGQPFGFMSMLGLFALVGIVVNNAIVLIDLTERLRREGRGIEEALQAAVEQRTRPILLTSITTVAGLLPLAISDTTLWPPLAWAMISGLAASTLLTLLVVPALYRLLFRRETVDGATAKSARLDTTLTLEQESVVQT